MAENVLETQKTVGNTPQISEKEAAEFKGRIPTGVKDQVVAINRARRTQALQKLKKDKNNDIAVTQDGMERFLEEFLANGGNATKAAAAVFNTTTTSSASSMGSKYLRQARDLGRIYMDNKGHGYGKLLDHALEKMAESKGTEWWDRVMKIAGYESPEFDSRKQAAGQNTINIVGAQNSVRKKFGFNEEAEVVDAEEL